MGWQGGRAKACFLRIERALCSSSCKAFALKAFNCCSMWPNSATADMDHGPISVVLRG